MNALNTTTVRRRFRRQVTSFMLVLSLSMGAIVATPTPAHAAGSYVLAQFSISGRFPVLPCACMSDVAGATVEVWYSLDGRSWNLLLTSQVNTVGTFGLNAPGAENWYFAMRVNHLEPTARFVSDWAIFYPYDRNTFSSPRKALVHVW